MTLSIFVIKQTNLEIKYLTCFKELSDDEVINLIVKIVIDKNIKSFLLIFFFLQIFAFSEKQANFFYYEVESD